MRQDPAHGRARRREGTSTGVFGRAGSTCPRDRDRAVQPPCHPPRTGTAPAQRGNDINSNGGGHGAHGDPSAEGTLDVFGLEEGLLQGHGAHALCRTAVPRLARLPGGTRGAGDARDALLSHGAWGTHLPVAWWPLGTWKRQREGGGRVRGGQRTPVWSWWPWGGRGLTWGSWGAAVPHHAHTFLSFLSFGARLTWRRGGWRGVRPSTTVMLRDTAGKQHLPRMPGTPCRPSLPICPGIPGEPGGPGRPGSPSFPGGPGLPGDATISTGKCIREV